MPKTTASRRWPPAGIVLALGCLVLGVGLGRPASAEAQARHARDQNIQPVYEGWERNPDGSYNMLFGYLNRNWVEEPEIPIGEDNSFSPGPADRGQPTHFYPRRQLYVFKVRVPADWGDQRLVWTVTRDGRTDQAVGKLIGFYEHDAGVYLAQRVSRLRATPEERRSQAPSIALVGPDAVTASVGEPLALAVTASDDGVPGPSQSRFARPITERPAKTPDGALRQDMVSGYVATATGLAVTWLHYRGPGMVAFDPMHVSLDTSGGRATTAARFSEPGTYVIRAVANDQIFTTPVNVTVTVTAGSE